MEVIKQEMLITNQVYLNSQQLEHRKLHKDSKQLVVLTIVQREGKWRD
jgi:hypothetical protein